jgi:hypothetical protein
MRRRRCSARLCPKIETPPMIAASPTSAPLSGSEEEPGTPARCVAAARAGVAWKVTLDEGAVPPASGVAAGAGESAVTSCGAEAPDRGRATCEAGFARCRRGAACPCFAVRVVLGARTEVAVLPLRPVFLTILSVLRVVLAVPPRGVTVLARSLAFADGVFAG